MFKANVRHLQEWKIQQFRIEPVITALQISLQIFWLYNNLILKQRYVGSLFIVLKSIHDIDSLLQYFFRSFVNYFTDIIGPEERYEGIHQFIHTSSYTQYIQVCNSCNITFCLYWQIRNRIKLQYKCQEIRPSDETTHKIKGMTSTVFWISNKYSWFLCFWLLQKTPTTKLFYCALV